MKIAILLLYKENFSPEYPGAVSLFVNETSKISKYKKRMISMISKLCKIKKDQINIKGKTAEKLGVIGKEKAIACEVISSVFKYE